MSAPIDRGVERELNAAIRKSAMRVFIFRLVPKGVNGKITITVISPKMKILIALFLIAAFTSLPTPRSIGADKPVPAEKPATKAARSLPFHGKVVAVDKDAKILTVGERKFHAASTTKIMKAGKPAILTDAVVGEEVGGAYREVEGGRLELVSLRIGPKPADEKK